MYTNTTTISLVCTHLQKKDCYPSKYNISQPKTVFSSYTLMSKFNILFTLMIKSDKL